MHGKSKCMLRRERQTFRNPRQVRAVVKFFTLLNKSPAIPSRATLAKRRQPSPRAAQTFLFHLRRLQKLRRPLRGGVDRNGGADLGAEDAARRPLRGGV